MSTAKGKERAANPISNVTIAVTSVIFTKDTFFKVTDPDIFAGDRKKFKVYESQYRIYL
jgi:hypothetical protein